MTDISYPLTGRYGKDNFVLLDEESFNKITGRRLCCLKSGYVMIWNKETNKAEYLHRWLFGLEKGDNRVVDHIDRNKLNCRMDNLRLVTTAENMQNRSKLTRKTSSIYKGVHFDKRNNKWQAHIRKDGKLYHLGLFVDEKEAARAYNTKATELNQGFALLNIIEL